jgi:CopG family nickel-responsive transcriptional regulator
MFSKGGFELGSPPPLRIGVYLPGDLAERLLGLMKELGVSNFSRVVQDALRVYIVEHEWRTSGFVSGVIVVLYNHEVRGVDEALTDIQHDYLDLIKATMHIHLDRENCLLAIAVRGDSSVLRRLIGQLESLRGVRVVRPILIQVADR